MNVQKKSTLVNLSSLPSLPKLPSALLCGLCCLTMSACSNVGPLKVPSSLPNLVLPESLGSIAPLGTAKAVNSNPNANPNASPDPWWKSLQDPVLDALLNEAVANNQDAALATARIAEARANLSLSVSNRFPVFDATLGASRFRTSGNNGRIFAGPGRVANDFQLGLSASYEVDFWEKHNNADAAARARMLALNASRAMLQNTLVAEIVQRYIALRTYDFQLAGTRAILGTRRETLRLQQLRLEAGVVDELALNQAKGEVVNSEVATVQLQQLVDSTELALALLLGRSPAGISTPVIERGAPIEVLYRNLALPTDFSANLPSDLLQRRPDIVAAEQGLMAADADIGQARSQYFPSIKLSTSFGYESRRLQDLFNPASLLWNLGASLTQPLLRGAATDAVVAGATARKDQALAQYVQTVQSAFRDVHEALINLSANRENQDANERRAAVQAENFRLVQLRFNQGTNTALEMLNAQRDSLQIAAGLAEAQRGHLVAMVGLYKALGGGFGGEGLK